MVPEQRCELNDVGSQGRIRKGMKVGCKYFENGERSQDELGWKFTLSRKISPLHDGQVPAGAELTRNCARSGPVV